MANPRDPNAPPNPAEGTEQFEVPAARPAARPAAPAAPPRNFYRPPGAPSQSAPPRPPAPRPPPAPAVAPHRETLHETDQAIVHGLPYFPEPPHNLADTGLTGSMVEELLLKTIFFAGELRQSELKDRTKLPTGIVEESLEALRHNKYIDIKGGGGGFGRGSMAYVVTSIGNDLLRQVLERNRYAGPAPVSFDAYSEAVRRQTIRKNKLTRESLRTHFAHLQVQESVFDAVGPALNSGKALFLYGAPGNGKTALCQCMVDCFGDYIYIPYAIEVSGFIVKVFDELVHKRAPEESDSVPHDERWVKCRRPLVVVGGELTLDMLDLTYSSEVRYYEAPFQLKASNGILLIDDFGRQKVSPKDLLNRWIVPLESEFDTLTLHTGKKLRTVFDVFVVFSTNLEPQDLVDQAFLRRVRYKLEVARPDETLWRRIFSGECRKRSIPEDAALLDYLIDTHYKSKARPFNACEPRDLLDQVQDLCGYLGQPAQLSRDVIDRVTKTYFAKF